MLAARVILPQRRYADAVAMSAEVLRHAPDSVPALVVWATATARLLSTGWALYALASTLTEDAWFVEQFQSLRPAVSASADQEADAAFRKALALAPAALDVLMAYANFLWATRRFEEAEPILLKGVALSPGDYIINHALGAYVCVSPAGRGGRAIPQGSRREDASR